MRTRRTSQPMVLPALVRFMVTVLVIGSLLFYGLGGWYFADVVRADALEIEPDASVATVRIITASDTTVTFDEQWGP